MTWRCTPGRPEIETISTHWTWSVLFCFVLFCLLLFCFCLQVNLLIFYVLSEIPVVFWTDNLLAIGVFWLTSVRRHRRATSCYSHYNYGEKYRFGAGLYSYQLAYQDNQLSSDETFQHWHASPLAGMKSCKLGRLNRLHYTFCLFFVTLRKYQMFYKKVFFLNKFKKYICMLAKNIWE
jgi:hypothetical protein